MSKWYSWFMLACRTTCVLSVRNLWTYEVLWSLGMVSSFCFLWIFLDLLYFPTSYFRVHCLAGPHKSPSLILNHSSFHEQWPCLPPAGSSDARSVAAAEQPFSEMWLHAPQPGPSMHLNDDNALFQLPFPRNLSIVSKLSPDRPNWDVWKSHYLAADWMSACKSLVFKEIFGHFKLYHQKGEVW